MIGHGGFLNYPMQKEFEINKRILAIDFGEKRIGVAVSDPMKIIAQPLPTIESKSKKKMFRELLEIISRYDLSLIIVGMPYNLKGRIGRTGEKVEEFIGELQKKVAVPIKIWDERFTSLMAERTIHEMGKSPSRNKSKIDQISAQLILQNYLDSLPK